MKQLHAPKDTNGLPLRAGDRVRVTAVPDLTGMSEKSIAESLPVFEYLVGKYKRITRFDEFGLAWLDFAIPSGPHRGMHGVAIEPFLLQLPRKRGTTQGKL